SAAMTTSVARELVRSGHLVCSLRLAPFATSVVAVAAYLLARLGDTPEAIGDLRVVGLLLALGSGYALDDSAAITLQASPYGLARRLWLRTLVGHIARGDVCARGRDSRPVGAQFDW